MTTQIENKPEHPIHDLDTVKQNTAKVYRIIDTQGPISRIQTAELSGLAPASVTKITRQLLARGLIKEMELQASTGGRRATSIITETRAFSTIAVQLGRHEAAIGLYDLNGKMLSETHHPMTATTQQDLEVILCDHISIFINENKNKIKELIALAVVLPGLIDPDKGIVNYTPHIPVNAWPLGENLKNRLGIHTIIGHDIRSLALAEYYFGETSDCTDSLLIRLHRGTGCGIVVNRQVFLPGHRGNGGEIGHIQVDPLGKRCHCGNFGCLETIASRAAIESRAHQLLTDGHHSVLSPDACQLIDICNAANDGDHFARALIEDIGHYLGKVIATTVNLFNPQKIVISGDITIAWNTLRPAIENCINTQTLPAFRHDLPLLRTRLDYHSAIGAFSLIKEAMLNGELLQMLLKNNEK